VSEFLDALSRAIHFGFGYVTCDDGSVLFELELATGEAVIARLSAEAVESGEVSFAELVGEERDTHLHTWMALMEIEADNAYRSMSPEVRRGAIFDVM
jgi:hypothetical protein